jgi:nitroreductase
LTEDFVMSTLLDALRWRYATKRMTGADLPAEKLDTILEAIRLSASSLGLQPYRLVLVSDAATKARIQESGACAQPQVKECAHLLVFATLRQIDESTAREYVMRMSTERGVAFESEAMQGFFNMVKGYIEGQSETSRREWAARQAYIGLGTGLAAAAMEQVDATPMEGFDAHKLDSVLGLGEKGLESRVLLALGQRDSAHDYLAQAKKVRLPLEQFVITM